MKVVHFAPEYDSSGTVLRQVHRFAARPDDATSAVPLSTVNAILGYGQTSYRGGPLSDVVVTRAPWFEVFNDYVFTPPNPASAACVIEELPSGLQFSRVIGASSESCQDTVVVENTFYESRAVALSLRANLSRVVSTWGAGSPGYFTWAPVGFTGLSFSMQLGPLGTTPETQVTIFFVNDANGTIIFTGPPDNWGARLPYLAIPAATGAWNFDWRADEEREYLLILEPVTQRIYFVVRLADGTQVNLLHDELDPSLADGYYDLSLGINASRTNVWETGNVPNGTVRGLFALNTDGTTDIVLLKQLCLYNIGQQVLVNGTVTANGQMRYITNDGVRLDTTSNPLYSFPQLGVVGLAPELRRTGLLLQHLSPSASYVYRLEDLGDVSQFRVRFSLQAEYTGYATGMFVAIAKGGTLYSVSPVAEYRSTAADGKQVAFYTGQGVDYEDSDSYEPPASGDPLGWFGSHEYDLRVGTDSVDLLVDGVRYLTRSTTDSWPATTLDDGFYLGSIFDHGSITDDVFSGAWQALVVSGLYSPVQLPITYDPDVSPFPVTEGIYPSYPPPLGSDLTVTLLGDGYELDDQSVGGTGTQLFYWQQLPTFCSYANGVSVEAVLRLLRYEDETHIMTPGDTGFGLDIDTGVVVIPLRFLASEQYGDMLCLVPDFSTSFMTEMLDRTGLGELRTVLIDSSGELRIRLEYKPGLGVYLFVNGIHQLTVDWLDIQRHIASPGNWDTGRFPASIVAAPEVRIGSLTGEKGSCGTLRDIQLSVSNGFDVDLSFLFEADESVDGADGFLLVDGRDT